MLRYPIFKYKEFASCNFLGGNTDSFEITIKDSDSYNLEYLRETFDEEFIESKTYKLSVNTIEKIKKIINDNQALFEINSNLNNGSLDGAGQTFWFATENKNREITAWNIDDSIDDGREVRKEYLEEYGDNLKQERLILRVFFEISTALKEDGILLDLYKFKGNDKILYKLNGEI